MFPNKCVTRKSRLRFLFVSFVCTLMIFVLLKVAITGTCAGAVWLSSCFIKSSCAKRNEVQNKNAISKVDFIFYTVESLQSFSQPLNRIYFQTQFSELQFYIP